MIKYKLKKEVKYVILLFMLLVISLLVYNKIWLNPSETTSAEIKLLGWLYLSAGNVLIFETVKNFIEK